jgi:hypothetical protein
MNYTKKQLEKLLMVLFDLITVQDECINLLEANNQLLKEINEVLREDINKLSNKISAKT